MAPNRKMALLTIPSSNYVRSLQRGVHGLGASRRKGFFLEDSFEWPCRGMACFWVWGLWVNGEPDTIEPLVWLMHVEREDDSMSDIRFESRGQWRCSTSGLRDHGWIQRQEAIQQTMHLESLVQARSISIYRERVSLEFIVSQWSIKTQTFCGVFGRVWLAVWRRGLTPL